VRRSGSFTLVPPPNEEHDPLVKLAHVVKLRVRDVPNDRVAAAVARLRPFGVRLLADQVENRASFDICRRLGFNYFQGFHFTRPETIERRELPPEMVRIARLMTLAVDMGVRDAELEEELRKDPGLAFKLLRMVNAAASGGRGIESILHAIRLVGRSSLHRWLSLLFASSSPKITEDEREMILLSLERARFCELIAIEAEHDYAAGSAFLTGLLSSFDAVLGLPMRGVLDQIGVAEDVRFALLGQPGPFTNYLQLATAYAGAEWDTVIDLSNGLGAVKQELPRLYSSAGRWARTAMVKS
jgi:EAL and modified HD-GYP domain-containing signal transduction protein